MTATLEPEAQPASVAASSADFTGPLTPTGPRVGADRGTPQTAIRVLFDSPDGRIQVGIWECTPGGWSIVDRGDTEIVTLLVGRAVITDADGTAHPLGPGDSVTLPRGWSGRWDIEATVRKLYVTVKP